MDIIATQNTNRAAEITWRPRFVKQEEKMKKLPQSQMSHGDYTRHNPAAG